MEQGNRTLQRGLQILETISSRPSGLNLTEISELLSLPKSSAHNLVHTLETSGYVRLNSVSKYVLTLKVYEIGIQAVQDTDEGHEIRRAMREAFDTCQETMHLGIRSGMEVLYVDKIESSQSVHMSSRIGSRMPLFCTAMGKAFLMTLEDAEIRNMYPEKLHPALTSHTITHRGELLSQLGSFRKKGYATECEENAEGIACIAVPVLDRDGHAAYAISFSLPIRAWTDEKQAQCVKSLQKARDQIARQLTFR